MTTIAISSTRPEALQRVLERLRRCPGTRGDRRRQRRRGRRLNLVHRIAERKARRQVERDRHRRQLAEVIDLERPDVGLQPGDRLERDRAARRSSGRSSSDIAAGSLLELRRDPQDHLILIVRRVDLRDLPRAVGVVERVLDLVRGQAERRQLVAVHLDGDLRVLELQVAADVLEARHLPHLVFEHRRPPVQLGGVGVLQRELIERATAAAAEVDRRRVRS